MKKPNRSSTKEGAGLSRREALRRAASVGALVFEGYPRYAPGSYEPPVIGKHTRELSEMPRILGPGRHLHNDYASAPCHSLEDPRQLLSGCVTDYAVEQLRLNGNNPASLDRYASSTFSRHGCSPGCGKKRVPFVAAQGNRKRLGASPQSIRPRSSQHGLDLRRMFEKPG